MKFSCRLKNFLYLCDALHILISIRGDLRTEDTYNRNINNYPAMGVVCESHNCICRKEYVESSPKAGFFIQLVMLSTNSTQTLPVAGMSNQYDATLINASKTIHAAYPGATYIRVKYLDRDKNRLSLKIGTAIDGHTVKIHLRAYGFTNLFANLANRLSSQPSIFQLMTRRLS